MITRESRGRFAPSERPKTRVTESEREMKEIAGEMKMFEGEVKVFEGKENLSKEDLFQRCLGGHTQNANGSFNSTVWRLAPKHLHCGLKNIEIAAYLVAGVFNEGHLFILRIMDNENQRVARQERRSLLETKEARETRREQFLMENELYEEAEGLLYGPGMAD
ncbi:hypothetical protein ALC56_00101 [Trachymyrmex septentrionalis]|uniref:Uncharacterized protein n=1 Tax=Trachymyrmex septentrionalis TaxID=34720 RepID=A0A195FYM7_9HYME|nr:hypothetical protein ALC56_00101 [Trachymyrmex septentrionalis]